MQRNYFNQLFEEFIIIMKREFDKVFKNKIAGISSGRIVRGTNPSLSTVLEDEFAIFLSKLYCERDYQFLIDVSFSTKLAGEIKGSTIRPDIVVVDKKTNEIKVIFELKIDDARADDKWVNKAKERLNRLKRISEDKTNQSYISYKTLRVNEEGEPVRRKKRNSIDSVLEYNKYYLKCKIEAQVVCIALCNENSRGKTVGDNALYLSKKHLNNQNYSLNDFIEHDKNKINRTNLNYEGLFNVLQKLAL